MSSSITIQIGDTQFVIPGQIPRTLSSFFRFIETSVAGTITVKTIMLNAQKSGTIKLRENKPAGFYLAKGVFQAPKDLFMITIDTQERMDAAVFSFPPVSPDAAVSTDQDEGVLNFEEKYLPQGLIPTFEIFVSTTDSSADISGWIKFNEKSKAGWKRYALGKLPIANAVGVGTMINDVATIFGAPFHHVPGNPKAGRGTCVISPASDQSYSPWFFFAAGHCEAESVRILNKLAEGAKVRIILYDSSANLFWDLTGQKSPQPQSQLSDIRAFALFVPDKTSDTSSGVSSNPSSDTKE